MSLPPPSGADDEDGSVSLGFEVDATPETFDADAFTASLADELGINAASISVLSTEVVDNGLDNGINVVASGAPRQLRTPVASTEIGGPPDRMLSPRSTARSGSASAAAAALAAAGAAAWAVAAAAGAP